jgi:hypothetical protein
MPPSRILISAKPYCEKSLLYGQFEGRYAFSKVFGRVVDAGRSGVIIPVIIRKTNKNFYERIAILIRMEG